MNRLNIYTTQKGSTFIIVIGILSVLVVIATALSFSTRMELLSSANFADGVQARISAATGVARALKLLNEERRYTSLLQEWAAPDKTQIASPLAQESTTLINRGGMPAKKFARTPTTSELLGTELTKLTITDQCAKININTVTEDALARALTAILKDQKIGSASQAKTIARKIVQYRLGEDQKPGLANVNDNVKKTELNAFGARANQGRNNWELKSQAKPRNSRDRKNDETNEGLVDSQDYLADIRLPAFGDDRRWHFLTELRNIPEVDEKTFQAISPHLTIFSASEEIYFINDNIYPRVNVNYALATEIYDALKKYFPDKDTTLLKQYAVNIVDFRDPDSIPQVFPGSDPAKPIIGIELTPYITEIYSDSRTDSADGDDGQFVELYNPYDREIDVNGWQLQVGGSLVTLTGKIYPQGYLIITDDYNEANDPQPEDDIPNYGSFYDIFNEVPDNITKRLIEEPLFDIPDDEGIVYLRDKQGNLIDYQPYRGGRYTGVSQSFQRLDPRVRYVQKITPTPFALPAEARQSGSLRLSLNEIMRRQNTLFTSPVEVMYVSSSFVNEADQRAAIWKEPELQLTNAIDSLDSRVIDLFTVAPILEQKIPPALLEQLAAENNPAIQRQLQKTLQILETPTVLGRININTATFYTLLTLPGITDAQAQIIVENRYTKQNQRRDSSAATAGETTYVTVPFKTISDLLRYDVIWQQVNEAERLQQFACWANMITTNSRAFSVLAHSAPVKPLKSSRRDHPISVYALLALDQTDTPVIFFKYLNR